MIFKRGINLDLSDDQRVSIPDDEIWKVVSEGKLGVLWGDKYMAEWKNADYQPLVFPPGATIGVYKGSDRSASVKVVGLAFTAD